MENIVALKTKVQVKQATSLVACTWPTPNNRVGGKTLNLNNHVGGTNTYSLDLVHLIPYWLVWAEIIYCMGCK